MGTSLSSPVAADGINIEAVSLLMLPPYPSRILSILNCSSSSVCSNTHVLAILKKIFFFILISSSNSPLSLTFCHHQTSLNHTFLSVLYSGCQSHHSTEPSVITDLVLLHPVDIFAALILSCFSALL